MLKTGFKNTESGVPDNRKTDSCVLELQELAARENLVTDEIVRRFLNTFTDKTIAVISVDPSKKKTGGALLGDRIRMNSISHPTGLYA